MKKKEMKTSTFIIIASIILVLIMLFAVSAFGKQHKRHQPRQISTNLHKPFEAKATIKMKDLTMEADINKTDIGACTFKIKEPKSLKGMEFQYTGDDVLVSYKGLSVKLNEDSKLATSLAGIIVKSIDKAASPSGVDVEIDGKKLLVKGDSDAGKFNILLDKQTGSIISLKLPELDFECNFDDFIFNK